MRKTQRTRSQQIFDNATRADADRSARILKKCQCRILTHITHVGDFCPEKLGASNNYYRTPEGRVLRICNKCATQIRTSQSEILELPY